MTTKKRQPSLGKTVQYASALCSPDTELGSTTNAAIITHVYREGFYSEPVDEWLVDLAVLSRNGVVNISKVKFSEYQTHGRWSWLEEENE